MIKLIRNVDNRIGLSVQTIRKISGYYARLSLNSKTYTVPDILKENVSIAIPKDDVAAIYARGKGIEGFLRAYDTEDEKQLELRIWFRVCDTERDADGFQTLNLQFTDTGDHGGGGGGGGGGEVTKAMFDAEVSARKEGDDKTLEDAKEYADDREITAANVKYDNPEYPTVKAALDKLLYVAPAINSFTGGGTYENGKSVDKVSFAWTLNKDVTTQSISNGVGEIAASKRAYTYAPSLPITSNTTFTLTVGDGTKTATRSTSISFQNKVYWGVSAKDSLDNADILAFETAGKASFATGRAMTKTFDCSAGGYFYFAIPTDFCTGMKMVVGGLAFSDFSFVTKEDFVNASGKTVSYNVYRPNSIQHGSSITVEVK